MGLLSHNPRFLGSLCRKDSQLWDLSRNTEPSKNKVVHRGLSSVWALGPCGPLS